jgi:heme-degrading monooxygenase HmoA
VVTIGMNYRVLPGKEQQFEGACRKVIEVMGAASGHDASQIYRRVDGGDASEYLIVSRWSDEDAFGAFLRSEAFKKVTSWGLAHILAGRPTHTTYREG